MFKIHFLSKDMQRTLIRTLLKVSLDTKKYFSKLLSVRNQKYLLICTLLCEVTIDSIGQCFVVFFHPHLNIKSKASAYRSRHLHIESKKSAYTIGTCFRFYMQMRLDIQALVLDFIRKCGWKKKNKAFAYRIYSHLTQQCRK